jgi:hypothetical protein
MTIETTTRISICSDEEWFYTVEDKNIATSMDGCTISYWEGQNRKVYITMEPEEALAVADAIYKLFKKDN